MGLPVSLIRRQNHFHALSALGIVPEKPVFPAVVDCPLCRETSLYLFDDILSDGVWAHCEKCRAHGDIITFGARIWNTSVAAAMNRFIDMDVASKKHIDLVSGEYLRAVARIDAAQAFWEESATQLWNHNDDIMACRLRELGLDHTLESCKGLVGVAHHDQVAEFCRAVGRAVPPRMRENGPCLVLPYFDLPDRISGCLLVQYDEQFVSRRTFIYLSGLKHKRPEAGNFMLHTALLPCPENLRNSYFVTDDPFWLLRVQMGQLKAGLGLLPIAASYHGPEARSSGYNWRSFAHTPRFFHSGSFTPEVVSQAAAAKGYVCVLPPEKFERGATPSRSLLRLAAIRRTAKTWQDALEQGLKDINDTAAETFFSRLHIEAERLHSFLNMRSRWRSPEFNARLLARVDTSRAVLPTKIKERWVILERDGGWWSHTNSMICSARLRIHKVVHSSTGDRLYIGAVYINGRELPFTDSAAKIENTGLLAFAAQHAAAAGLLLVFDKRWNTRSHQLAMQISPPEIVHVSGESGWNAQNSEFNFARYAIGNDGSVRPSPYPAINVQRVVDFPEPSPMAPVTIRQLLTPSHENAFLWTAAATVLADVLAPVVNRAARPTACAEKAFAAAKDVGAALACPQNRVTLVTRTDAARSIDRVAQTAKWPEFFYHTFDDKALSRTLVQIVEGPIVVRLPEVMTHLAPGYGWNTLAGSVPEALPDLEALRYVLPSYVQRALETRMSFAAGQDNLAVAVLTDMAGWLKDIYATTFNLPCALNRLVTPAKAHEALMAAVDSGILAGQIDVLPRPRQKSQSGSYVLRNKKTWWLNQKAIDRYCVSAGGVTPNWRAITDLLADNNLLRGENTVHNMHGLLVEREWCDQFWTDYRAPDVRELG